MLTKGLNKSYCLDIQKHEVFTPKSCTNTRITNANTWFDDADFVVANEDEQKLENVGAAVRDYIEIVFYLNLEPSSKAMKD